jgi:hypothetical protein
MKSLTDHPSIAAAKRQLEPEIEWRFTPRLEPGEYSAYCRSTKTYRDGQFKRWVCAVQFDVLRDDLETRLGRVTWFLNLGNRDKPQATRRSNYMSAWVLAHGGPPSRGDRMSPNIFKRRHARVVVADTGKDFKQKPVDGQSAYSVIKTVLRWDTGGTEL